MFTLIIIASLNLVISLYYYLRVVKAMFVDVNDTPLKSVHAGFPARLGLVICSAAIILTGFFSFVYQYIYSFSNGLQ